MHRNRLSVRRLVLMVRPSDLGKFRARWSVHRYHLDRFTPYCEDPIRKQTPCLKIETGVHEGLSQKARLSLMMLLSYTSYRVHAWNTKYRFNIQSTGPQLPALMCIDRYAAVYHAAVTPLPTKRPIFQPYHLGILATIQLTSCSSWLEGRPAPTIA
jgi:hypothetical protein